MESKETVSTVSTSESVTEEVVVTTEEYVVEDDEIVDPQPRADGQHPLRYPWTLWFMHRAPGEKITDYEAAIKKIGVFTTVGALATYFQIEEFWALYSHLRRPNELPNVSDYHLFKEGIRPVWEDDSNKEGGKWIVRLKKGLASRYWESLFEIGREICGAVLSMRNSEDILSLWNRTASNNKNNLRIRDTIKRILNLPTETVMEYKTHNDAIKDQSSFRNTDVYK